MLIEVYECQPVLFLFMRKQASMTDVTVLSALIICMYVHTYHLVGCSAL